MNYYIIFETYNEINRFEGRWVIGFKQFRTLRSAGIWKTESEEAAECRKYKRTLIGPLQLVKGTL